MDKKIYIVAGAVAVGVIGYIVWRAQAGNGNGGSYAGPTVVTVQVYDSRATMNPVQGIPVRLRRISIATSVSSTTNTEGQVIFNENGNYDEWMIVPDLYSITLDNTYYFEYDLTEPEHTFVFFQDELIQ